MSGSRREIWKEILNRFEPDLVTRPAWRADRNDSPAGKIISSLDRPTASPLSRALLTYGRLLPYPNESEWFYPHPLLTLNLVQVP